MVFLGGCDDNNLIAQVLADFVDFRYKAGDVLGVMLMVFCPPFLEFGALVQLVLEDGVCLVEELAEVGNADEELRVLGDAGQQIA